MRRSLGTGIKMLDPAHCLVAYLISEPSLEAEKQTVEEGSSL